MLGKGISGFFFKAVLSFTFPLLQFHFKLIFLQAFFKSLSPCFHLFFSLSIFHIPPSTINHQSLTPVPMFYVEMNFWMLCVCFTNMDYVIISQHSTQSVKKSIPTQERGNEHSSLFIVHYSFFIVHHSLFSWHILCLIMCKYKDTLLFINN